jgi:hypothetical protein
MDKPAEDGNGSGGSSPPSKTTNDVEAETETINERALLRKIDAKLLPAVGILYLLSFLDRSNGMYRM